MGRHFDKAVTIATIHPELAHVNIVRERDRLDWLVAYAGIFGRGVIPGRCGQTGHNENSADRKLQREPVSPAWEKIRHKWSADARAVPLASPT